MKYEYIHKQKCPLAPYQEGREFDQVLELLMKGSLKACKEKDKSVTGIIVGDVGSGKSTKACHIYEIVDPQPSVDRIAHDTKSFAEAIKVVDESESRFLMHDEFNISSRDAMKDKNKDMIDLLFSIRGENWFLIGNNPSSATIDKSIIEEGIVNWVIFISVENSKYLFFTRKQFLDLIKEQGSSSFYNLKTHGRYYATYEGWFKEYKGSIWKDYLKVKSQRMKEKKDKYVRKYSQGDLSSMNKASDIIGCDWATVRKVYRWGKKNNMLVDGRDFYLDAQKKPKFTDTGIQNMKHIYTNEMHTSKGGKK
jgi:ABC-type dipeptide/oligopeptide/nickel transport system ATPase component